MLHVDPPSAAAIPVGHPVQLNSGDRSFDPIAYVAFVRRHGLKVEAKLRNGVRQLSWDIEAPQPDVGFRRHEDRRLSLDADPENEHLVWEVLRAEAWLAAARACGLVVFPWLTIAGRPTIMQCGYQEDGPNSFSDALDRFVLHPDFAFDKSCRKAIIFDTVCADYGVRRGDPDLCAKVDAELRSRYLPDEQVAS